MKTKWKMAGISFVLFAAMIFLGNKFPPVFYLNDDATIRQILSGAYTGTPTGNAIQMMYPLTGVLSVLYQITDSVPWMDLLFNSVILIAGSVVLEECFDFALAFYLKTNSDKSMDNQKVKRIVASVLGGMVIVAGLWLCGILFTEAFLYMHYTVVAAVLAGSGIVLWIGNEKKGKSILLLMISLMVRKQIFFLALPFWAVAVLWEFVFEDKRGLNRGRKEQWEILKTQIIKVSRPVLGLFLGVVICFVLQSICYRSEGWKEFWEYFDARTNLYDYTNLHSTDRYEELYRQWGVTDMQFELLTNYNTLLDNGYSVDSALVEKMYDEISALQAHERNRIEYAKFCIREYINQMRYCKPVFSYICIGFYLAVFVLCLFNKRWWKLLLTLFLGIGRNFVWLYLIWQGRFPERIVYSLFLLEILLLFGMFISLAKESKHTMAAEVFLVAMSILMIKGTFVTFSSLQDKLEDQYAVQAEWKELQEIFTKEKDELYLMDVFSIVGYGNMQFEPNPSNMIMAGGWMMKSPLAAEVFERYGAKDGLEAMYNSPNVYFVATKQTDISWLHEYIDERYDEGNLVLQREVNVSSGKKTFCVYFLDR